MSTVTPNEGLVIPLTTDYADVQDWYQLARQADTAIRQYDATFRAAPRPRAFLGRSTSRSSTFTAGSAILTTDVVEWDSSGQMVAGGNTWSQPPDEPPSWWMFGANLYFVLTAGSYTLTDHEEAVLQINTADQVSGVQTTSYLRSKRIVTGTGEYMTLMGAALIYRGSVTAMGYGYGSSTATVALDSGSRMWGFRLGAAST